MRDRRNSRRRRLPVRAQGGPVSKRTRETAEAESQPERLKTDAFENPGRILVVDDDDGLRDTLASLLEQDLHTVFQATNGQEALDMAFREKPDVIVLDIKMPVMDGFTACQKLKADPHLHYAPVLVLTAAADAQSQMRALECGANDFLAKPVSGLVLRTRVRALLKYRRALQALERHQAELERRVEERTAELLEASAQLRDESEERRKAQEALERERVTLRTMLDNLPDIVFFKDMASRFVAINKNVLADLQAERTEDVLGKTDFDFLPPDIAQVCFEEEQRILRTGQPVLNKEVQHPTPNGQGRLFLSTKLPLRDSEGRTIGLLGINRDVSEYKRLEQQLRQAHKMDAIGQLAGGIAHDFNNMLMVILGYAECLQTEQQLLPAHEKQVACIHHAAERAARLTRQLLTFSRRQVLQLEIVSLNAVLTDMDQLLQRLIGEHIRTATRLAPDAGWVRADTGQLQQVVMNLVLNARDAMPDGGQLVLETSNQKLDPASNEEYRGIPAGSYVVLKVTDTGQGMNPETQARLFEPFFTTKPFGKGTGLGLSVVYGVVKQSGGHIHLTSAVNHGTTFTIFLPAVTVEGKKDTDALSLCPGNGTETILLVEDEDEVRGLARVFLTQYGYQVLEESDPVAALDRAATFPHPIHLIVTDVLMPNLNGTQFVERLRKTRPATKVLYISGYPAGATTNCGVLTGEDGFLQKPFSATDLSQKVREMLDRR